MNNEVLVGRCILGSPGCLTEGIEYHLTYDGMSEFYMVKDDSGYKEPRGWAKERFELIPCHAAEIEATKDAFSQQVGGTHYKDMKIQPAEYILANGIGWAEGDAIAYISRWKAKGGLQDLRKAIGTLNLLIANESSKASATGAAAPLEAKDGNSA